MKERFLHSSGKWELKRLGEVCKTGSGGTPLKVHKDYYENGVIPWLLSGEVDQKDIVEAKNFITENGLNNSSARLFPPNTVLVAMYGATAGQVGILRFEAATNQAVCGILPNANTIPEFIYYCLLSKKEELISQATGNAQPNISQIKIKNTVIPIPPLPEQQQIVVLLDEAFAAIDQAKANIERNIRNARELFQSKLNEVFSGHVLSGAEGGGDGWVERKLGEVCVTITDGDHQPPPKAVAGIPFITISNIDKKTNKIDFSNSYYVPIEYYKQIKENKKPVKGDVLYTVTGSFGIPVLINFDKEFCFQRHIGLIRPNNTLDSHFLFYWILSPASYEQANKEAIGTAQRTVSLKSLRNFTIILPSLLIQKEIVKNLKIFSSHISKLENEYYEKLSLLEDLKKSLLQKAFSGELTVFNHDLLDSGIS